MARIVSHIPMARLLKHGRLPGVVVGLGLVRGRLVRRRLMRARGWLMRRWLVRGWIILGGAEGNISLTERHVGIVDVFPFSRVVLL